MSPGGGDFFFRIKVWPQLVARYLTINCFLERDNEVRRDALIPVYALPDTGLARIASAGKLCLASGQTDYRLYRSFFRWHVCVPQWIVTTMITQVIKEANTCYLKGDNACFTLSGMNEDSGTLKDRIYARRVALGLSQQQLAEKAGVSQVTIQHLESGRNATSKRLVEIARALNVSAEWLDSGKPATSEPSNVAPTVQPNMSYRYPVISWVAAGAWAEAVEPFPPGFSDRYEISDYNSKGAAFWLEVRGDSMTAPTGTSIPEGMMILVDTEAEVTSGKLVIAKLAHSGEATFKKLVEDGGRRYLKPLNPEYKMVECGEDCRIIGVAVRVMGKL